ncbi:resolvase [Vibrio phage 1.063.O._10N.261.45.C7]|nr:resolvase [Vibrio phage 1.063.O._10N.261.45.C7]
MKVIIYKRLSKEDRTKTQHGFNSQQRDIDFYLSDVEHKVIGTFQEFVSGGEDSKPELKKAMELCRTEGATLVVAKLDRLSRRVSQVAAYMEGDVKFKVAALPQADNFQLHLYAALSEQERTMIRQRVKAGLDAAKAKGVKLGGASDKWQKSYNRSKSKHVSKTNHIKSQESWESKRSQIEGVLKIMGRNKISLTYKNISSNMNDMNIKTATGGKFTPSQALRALSYLNITR